MPRKRANRAPAPPPAPPPAAPAPVTPNDYIAANAPGAVGCLIVLFNPNGGLQFRGWGVGPHSIAFAGAALTAHAVTPARAPLP